MVLSLYQNLMEEEKKGEEKVEVEKEEDKVGVEKEEEVRVEGMVVGTAVGVKVAAE
mgnify:CR=1 FL=1